MTIYDLMIIGGGPAGVTAGIYAKRAMINVVLIEKGLIGGQLALTTDIENYPGFQQISGIELATRLQKQIQNVGLQILNEEVKELDVSSKLLSLKTYDAFFQSKSVIIASGATPLSLNVEGEKRFLGKGVSYCATCDGPLFKDKVVAVIGGGDSAIKEALYLARIAKRVYVVHRRDELRSEKIIAEKAFQSNNIEFIWNSTIKKFIGRERIEKIALENKNTLDQEELAVDGVFIYVGRIPNTQFVKNIVKDELGYVLIDEKMKTSADGVFAAGECTSPHWRQIATSIGEGAKASISAIHYLEKK